MIVPQYTNELRIEKPKRINRIRESSDFVDEDEFSESPKKVPLV